MHEASKASQDFDRMVLRWVAAIPSGTVATYGQIAALSGYPRRARHVGRALCHLPAGSAVPWHRVINAQGKVSPRKGESHGAGVSVETLQTRLLKAEGLPFRRGRIDLSRHQWRPEEMPGALLAEFQFNHSTSEETF